MTSQLRVFLPSPSSKFFPQVTQFLQSKGVCLNLEGRSLSLRQDKYDFVFARGFDIPNLITKGWGDVGITGLDAVQEAEVEIVLLRKLGIRYSDIVLASMRRNSVAELKPGDLIVTEYKKLAVQYFQKKQLSNLELFFVTGSAEALGTLPEVSAIVTLKTSGRTLTDNRLNVLDTLFKSQACLIANQAAIDSNRSSIQDLLNTLDKED